MGWQRDSNRVRGRGRGLGVLLVVLLAWFNPVNVNADEVWRLAGTFNSWNPHDDALQLTALPDGTFFLQAEFAAGRHEFKFVRNGDWSQGHFGGVGPNNPAALTRPGGNLVLALTAAQPISIIFDPAKRTWRRGVPTVSEPVVVASIVGLPQIGLTATLDLSETLLPEGIARVDEFEIQALDPARLQIDPPTDGDPANPIRSFLSQQGGPTGLVIRARVAGQWSEPTTLEFTVHDRVYAILSAGSSAGPIDLVPINGTAEWAAILKAPSANLLTAKVQDLSQQKYLTTLIRPKKAGEEFALVYSRYTNSARAIPGDFALVADGLQYELQDHTVLPTAPADGVFHDPRRPDHFTPISAGLGLVDITALTAKENDPPFLAVVVLLPEFEGRIDSPINPAAVQLRVPMLRSSQSSSGHSIWQARIKLDSTTTTATAPRLHYAIERFTLDAAGNRVPVETLGPFKATIAPDFETPDWAKQAVWYQIFPERFRNGNPANDPHGEGVFPMPWQSEWGVIQPGEFEAWQRRVRANGADPDRWDRNLTGEPGGRFYNVVWDRRYGGDLQGISQALDYLQELGITALYLNPIFEGQSMHKYDTSDFRHVDDNFGNVTTTPPADWQPNHAENYHDPTTWEWTEADRTFLELIEEVHTRGMRIIIDGVFNHVGRNHPAFQDVVANGINSPFAGWFDAKFDADGKLSSWVAWDGPSGWLPKFKQEENRDLVYPVREHIFAITQRWMDPNGDGDPSDGIDGWRLDVPLDVGDPFWRDWCALVRSINPDAFIAAEIWSDAESVSRLRGDLFDAQMHYPFAMSALDWLGMKPGMSAAELQGGWADVFNNDTAQTQLVQQNLYASHDTDRLLSNLANTVPPRHYDTGNRPQQGEIYTETKPAARFYALDELALVLQATYVGAPMIYYGQEIGMYGADDPSNRKPRPWSDVGPMVLPDEEPNFSLEAFYREWLNIRRRDEVLQLGAVRPLSTRRGEVLAFERRLNDQVRLIVVNRGDSPFELSELATQTTVALPADGSVGPLSARLLPVPKSN